MKEPGWRHFCHDDNRIYKPALQGDILNTQSGCNGSFWGRMDLEVERGRVVDCKHQMLEVDRIIPPDPEVDDLVRQALALYQEELSTVTGATANSTRSAASMR